MGISSMGIEAGKIRITYEKVVKVITELKNSKERGED